MAFCPKCGKEVAPDVAFCPSCGFNVRSPPTQPAPAMAIPVPAPSAPKQKSNLMRNIAIVVVVVIVAIIALAALGAMGGSSHTVNVVNGLITVGARTYNDYQFSVPSGASGVSLQGSFTASGGSGNDIIVIVMDSANFTNWSNGHYAYSYYYSPQETTGTFNVNLQAGVTYYLVYSNEFSILSSKNVQTTVNLVYKS